MFESSMLIFVMLVFIAQRQAKERSASTKRQNGKGKKELTSGTMANDPDYGKYAQVPVSPSPLGV
jgi:hypothetical protein